MKQTHCKKGHAYAEHGWFNAKANKGKGCQVCLVCANENKKMRRRKAAGFRPDQLDTGASFASIRLKQAWAEKRKVKYGPSGTSEAGMKARMEKFKEKVKHFHYARAMTHCKHGHEYTPETVRIRVDKHGRKHRECLRCIALRKGRYPKFVIENGGKIFLEVRNLWYRKELWRLHQALLQAHPDRRGGRGKGIEFMAARKRLDKFKATWAVWYAQHGLIPPKMWKPRLPVSAEAMERRKASIRAAWARRKARESCAIMNSSEHGAVPSGIVPPGPDGTPPNSPPPLGPGFNVGQYTANRSEKLYNADVSG